MTSSIRPAATVILMREIDEGGFEIFLVKRSSRSSFGNLYVFPGGKLDLEDSCEDLYEYFEDINDAEASKKLGIKSDGLSYWIACVRECFEEVGVLLINPNDLLIQNAEKLNHLRKELNSKKIQARCH